MRKYILFLLLVFCTSLFAQKTSTYTKDEVDLKLELQQKEIEAKIKESDFSSDKAINKIENQNILITKQDKRIEDVRDNLNFFITVFSVILAIISIAAVVVGYIIDRNNRNRAEEAKNDFIELKANIEEQIKCIKDRAEIDVKLAQMEVEKALSEMEDLRKFLKDKKKEIEDNVQNLVKQINENKKSSDDKELKEDVDKAVEQLNTVKKESEFTASDWFLKGYDANEKEEFEEACKFYKKAIELDPNNSTIYNNWGVALYELGKQKRDKFVLLESFEKYKKAVDLKPDYTMTYNNWGVALIELAKLEEKKDLFLESIEKYKKVIKLDPNYVDAYNNWGSALTGLAKLEGKKDLFLESIEKYKKAIKLDPNYVMAYYNWGTTLLSLAKSEGDLKERKKDIEEKLLKAENLKQGYSAFNLACLYSLLNDSEEAFKWFETALDKGSTTREHIEKDTDLDNIRQDPRFNQLLDKYRPKKKEE